MSWHGFKPKEAYLLTHVLKAGDRRIEDGQVIAAEQKRGILELLRQHAPQTMIWSPFARKGWGASPFNPNCWQTLKGAQVLPRGIDLPR